MGNIALKAAHFAAVTLNNPFGIGTLSLALVFVAYYWYAFSS